MKAVWVGIGCVLLGLSLASPVAAQGDVGALAEEVAGVNRSLARLVELLEDSLANQRVELVLKRIDLKERRLAPLETELRDAENTVLRTESELQRIEDMREQQERQISRDLRDGSDSPDSDARQMMRKIETMVEFQQARLESGRERMRRLEDALAEGRRDMEVLEDKLAEMLEE
jgi:flagellar biosynthesis chaperone FliJ